MPLLLAIEADARQAACLTALVSMHLNADLVFAATVDAALAALQQRRPDLILASPDISPQDHAALLAGLNANSERHTEVPTLTIPRLSAHNHNPRRTRGLMARLRRPRAQDREAAAVAAQIAECLALTDAVRQAYAEATDARAAGAGQSGSSHAAMDLQVVVSTDSAEEPVVAAEWLDLAPLLDDEVRDAGAAAAERSDADVIELPPADELWAQLAPGYAARMAPLEGPSMLPRTTLAKPRDASAEMQTPAAIVDPLPLVDTRTSSDRPKQDEWGVYDPEQCGFAALLLRLAELADHDRRDDEPDDRSAIMRR